MFTGFLLFSGLFSFIFAMQSAKSHADPKNVLVMGGNGFVGFQLVEHLLKTKPTWQIVVVNRGNLYWNDDPAYFSSFPHFTLVKVDRQKATRLLHALEATKIGKHFDVVVDFSAYTPQDVQPLLAWLPKTCHYIFISSDSVYEASDISKHQNSKARVESDAQRPDDPTIVQQLREKDEYGDDKLRVEELLRKEKVLFNALRLPDVFGPRDNTDRHWQYQLLAKLAASGRKIMLTQKEQTRKLSMVFSLDVVDAIMKTIDIGYKIYGQSFNLGSSKNVSIREYLLAIGRALGISSIDFETLPEGRDNLFVYLPSVTERTGVVSIRNAIKTLGWDPTPFDRAIKLTVDWFEQAWFKFPQSIPRDEDLSDDEWDELQKLYDKQRNVKDEL